jgi:hypothetical protein
VTPISYDHSPQAVLIEADLRNEAQPTAADSHVTTWRLYGDGFVVFAGGPAPLSSGLDAAVQTGHLSEGQIAGLEAVLDQVGFYSLDDWYQPKAAATDAETARIGVYATHAKTVNVYAPEAGGGPLAFGQAWERIIRTIPTDAQPFVPTDAYLESTPAGAVTNFADRNSLADWPLAGLQLSDAVEGVLVSGLAYSQAAALVAQQLPNTLYREGNQVYSIRFAPNVPRAVHLTDWLGTILAAPREFDGRTFEIVGYYRGSNLFGEAIGGAPIAKTDWVIADGGGAMFVSGLAPARLDASSRADAWSVLRLDARVVYVRLGTSYLDARRVQILANSAKTPVPGPTFTPTASATETVPATYSSSTSAPASVTEAADGIQVQSP